MLNYSKSTLILLSLCTLTMLSCQEDIKYEQEFYDNGVVKKRFSVRNQKVIKYEEFAENGQLIAEIEIQDDKKNGAAKYYYNDGTLKMSTYFKNDIQTDTLKIYYENGQLKERSFVSNESKNGLYQEYFDTGELRYEGYLKNGYKDSLFRYYRPDQDYKIETFYNSGKLILDKGDVRQWQRHPLFGDSIEWRFPSNWIVNYVDKTTTILVDTIKLKGGFRTTATIAKNDVPSDMTFEEIIDSQIINLTEEYNDVSIIDSAYLMINNYKSFQIQYDLTLNDTDVSVFVSHYIVGDKYYLLSCLNRAEFFHSSLPFYKIIAETVSVPFDKPS